MEHGEAADLRPDDRLALAERFPTVRIGDEEEQIVAARESAFDTAQRIPCVGRDAVRVLVVRRVILHGAGPAGQCCGIATRVPPAMALSWAQRPTRVQFALVGASGNAGRSPSTAMRKLCARCG